MLKLLWFGLKDRVYEIEDKVDKILGLLTGKDEDTVRVTERTSNVLSNELPTDPNALRRLLVAKRLQRQIEREEMKDYAPKPQKPRENGELEVEPTPDNIAVQAREYYEAANPIIKMLISSEVKKRTGYDIQQILGDSNLLGQVISSLLGVAVGKLAEALPNRQQETGQIGPLTAGSGGPLFVQPYSPQRPPGVQSGPPAE